MAYGSATVLTYDGQPFYVVSIMEFDGGEVVRERRYFSDPFEPGPSRAQWVEHMEWEASQLRVAGHFLGECRQLGIEFYCGAE